MDADATAVYEGVKTVEELIAAAADDKLVKFTGTGDLKAASGVKLAGGTNVTSANGDVTAFVDKMEGIKFNTLCFPLPMLRCRPQPSPKSSICARAWARA